MYPLLEIPELARLEAGQGLVRIPEQQDVPFTSRVRALVDTAEFRRLANITQLGLVSRIYPGAMHTRFEHALGVFHNALRYLAQLARDARFRTAVDTHTAEVLLCSALLHDLGHWPFCHPIEDMGLAELPSHERHAAEFLSPERELSQILESEWNVAPAEVLDVLAARTDSTPLRIVRSILSGPIDIDKMDYLERDSLHCGVPYGRNFDKNRLIQSLVLNAAGDGLALSYKGKTAAELMVFARYVMFGEVYWHHAVRSATCMFARAFYELRDQLELHELLQRTEADVIAELRLRGRGSIVEPLLEGVFGSRRRIYKRVLDATLHQNRELFDRLSRQPFEYLVRCATRFAEVLGPKLGRRLSPCDILIDAPPRHREVEFKVDIYFPKEQAYRPLQEVSPVVRALAGTQFDDYVKRVRLFAPPEIAREVAQLPDLVETLVRAMDAPGETIVETRS
ncbi:MAG: HD domain-containing protein, partial [Planctomycetota bacterium]|nr:HD domain-containing protein [Planctomycetota bacterium]